MDRIIRIPSKQGTYDKTKRIVDISIPADSGVYDLRETYVNINVSGDAQNNPAKNIHNVARGDANTSVFPLHLQFVDSARNANANQKSIPPTNTFLVKNAFIRTSRRGKVEDIRGVNALRVNQSYYLKDNQSLHQSATGRNVLDMQTSKPFQYGNLADLNQGNVVSRPRTQDMKIYLNEIFDFCNLESYDSSYYGALDIHLELDIKETQVTLVSTFTATNPLTFDFHRDTNDVAGNANGKYRDMQNVPDPGAPGLAITSLDTSIKYETLDECPYYNNMKLQYTGTCSNAGKSVAAGGNLFVRVESMEHLASGAVRLNFDTTSIVTLVNGESMTAQILIFVEPTINADGSDIQYNDIDLVAKIGDMDGPMSYPYNYTTYHTISDFFQETAQFDRNYIIPANCVNVFIVFPNPVISIEQVLKYRFTLDNEELQDRDIDINSGNHYDQLIKLFKNSGLQPKSLLEVFRTSGQFEVVGSRKTIQIFGLPIPLKSSASQLGVHLENTTANLGIAGFSNGKIALYCQVIKSI